jgi:uncharacterized membrane protein
MLLTILVVLFAAIALFIGGFLFTHRQKSFLMFQPQTSPSLSKAVTFWGVEMLLVGIASLISAFMSSTIFIVSCIVIGCLSGTLLAITLMTFIKLN